MTSKTVISNLNKLSTTKETVKSLFEKRSALLSQALEMFVPADIKSSYYSMEAEIEALEQNCGHITDVIKDGVLSLGESVKADQLHAVFTKGRTTVDTNGLLGYAVAHPEVQAFIKTGSPSVSIREVK
jgi:hypothetical protein